MTAPAATRPVPSPAGGSGSRGRIGHGAGFWLVALAFVVAMAFPAAPTPLWAIYQRQDGFSTFTVTVVFAVYALGVLAALFLAGHVSDRLGRRPTLLAALVTQALAALVFVNSTALPALTHRRADRLRAGRGHDHRDGHRPPGGAARHGPPRRLPHAVRPGLHRREPRWDRLGPAGRRVPRPVRRKPALYFSAAQVILCASISRLLLRRSRAGGAR
jgi:hypothetical protein